MKQVLCLQNFNFEGTRADNFDGHVEIASGNGYCGQLKDTKLRDNAGQMLQDSGSQES